MPRGKYGTYFTSKVESCISKDKPIVSGNYIFDPIDIGGGNNPFTLNSEYATVVLAKVCGIIFGRFCNNTGEPKKYKTGEETIIGDHSEDYFMATWEELWDEPIMKQIRALQDLQGKPIVITLKITKSPCDQCSKKLIKFIQHYNVNLRLKILRLYSGDQGPIVNSFALLSLASTGVAVKMWDVLAKEKGFQKKTKLGQTHEMKYMTQHLKSSFLMTIDEDDAVEEKEKSNIEPLSDAFRKQILQMQEDSEQHLQKRLIEMNTKELHVKKAKAAIQKDFLQLSDGDYLYAISNMEDFLSPYLYSLVKEEKFSLELVCNAIGFDLCD